MGDPAVYLCAVPDRYVCQECEQECTPVAEA